MIEATGEEQTTVPDAKEVHEQPTSRTVSRTGLIARGVATSWLSTVVNAAVGILVVPVLLHRFGKEGYGLIAVMGVVVGMRTYLGLGLIGALHREMSAAAALGHRERFTTLLDTCYVIYASLGVVLSAACVFGAPAIARMLHVPASLYDNGIFLVRWYAAPTLLMSFIQPLFAAVLTSHNRFDLINTAHLVTALGRGGLMIAFAVYPPAGFAAWTAIMLSMQLAEIVLQWASAHRVWPGLRLRVSGYRAATVPSLLSLGIQLFLLQLIDIIGVTTDPIVLATYAGMSAVALYNPPASIAAQAKPLIDALKNQLDPVSSASFARGRIDELRHVLVRGTRLRVLMGVLACAVTGCLAGPITHVWLGRALPPGDVATMAGLLVLWSVIHLFTYAAGTQWPVLIGMRRVSFLTWLELPLAAANLLASIYLVGYARMGLAGVMYPTLAVAVIKRPFTAAYCAHQVGISASRYFRESYLRPMAVLVLLAAGAVGLTELIQPTTLRSLALAVLLVTCLWCLLAWFIGVDEEDRIAIRGVVCRARRGTT